MRIPCLLVLLVAAGSACRSPAARPAAPAVARTPPPPLRTRDPYTRTFAVEVDGERVGYVIRYDPLPVGTDLQRGLPEGSHLIQDPDFRDLGYVTPRGEVRRWVAGGESVSLGTLALDEGLQQLFQRRGRLLLVPLTPG